MKTINMKLNATTIIVSPILVVMTVLVTFLSGCSEEVTDFGFDGQISGMILDQNGNPVTGDTSNPELTVFVLGAEDRVPLELRVNNDGSYANTHLFPQSYRVWVQGPVVAPAEQVFDLTGAPVVYDISVIPFLMVSTPTATLSGNELTVNYTVTPSPGHEAAVINVLISTVAKVGVNSGNGPRWRTQRVTLDNNVGPITITLEEALLNMAVQIDSEDLHIRVAARSNQTTEWNYSLPIVVGL